MDDDDYSIEIITIKRHHYGNDEICSNEVNPSKKVKVSEAMTPLSPFDQALVFLRAGDDDGIRNLLNTGVLSSINLTNHKTDTLLMIACEEGRMDCVTTLLDLGANMALSINHRGKHPALNIAARHGHIEIVKLLILKGVKIDHQIDRPGSSLVAACEGGHLEVVTYLLEAGADIDTPPAKLGPALRAACQYGHVPVAELLLSRGANVNFREKESTALMAACKANKGDVVAFLLKHKADINFTDNDGCNALTIACMIASTDTAELLLQAGADATASVIVGGFTGTLLGYACSLSFTKIIRLLVRYGAPVDAADEKGNTALIKMCLAEEVDVGTVKVLLELHAEVNKPDRRGQTPLMLACAGFSVPLVEVLLDGGAAVNAVDDLGRTALYHVLSAPALKMLLSRGADVNIASKYRGSALLALTSLRFWTMALQLLEHGAGLHGYGITLITRARRSREYKLVDSLLDHEVEGPLFGADLARLADDQSKFPDLTKLLATTSAIEVKAPADGTKLTYRLVCARIKSGEIESFRGASRAAFVTAGDFAGYEENTLETAPLINRLDILELLLDCTVFHTSGLCDYKATCTMLLVDACLSGQFDTAKLILQYGADPDAKDEFGRVALVAACHPTNEEYNHEAQTVTPTMRAAAVLPIEMVKLLLAHNASVSNRHCKHYTPLIAATLAGNLEVMKVLLNHGADVRAVASVKASFAIIAACRYGTAEAVTLLRAYGAGEAIDKAECLMNACEYGNIEMVKCLLEQGESVDCAVKRYDVWYSPLYGACTNGKVEIAQLLLQRDAKVEPNLMPKLWVSGSLDILKLMAKHGADIHTADNLGRTPLHIASQHLRPDVVQWLLESGADVNKVDKEGKTALDLVDDEYGSEYDLQPAVILSLLEHGAGLITDTSALFKRACLIGCVGIVKILLGRRAAGSDTKPLSEALYTVSTRSSAAMVRLLIQHGATVAEADDGHEERPCLVAAVRANDPACLDVITTLLDNGADVNNAGTQQKTALAYACQNGTLKVIKLLIARGADTGAVDADDDTALIQASVGGKIEVFKLLLASGADVEKADSDGNTPLILAAQNKKTNRVRPLLEAGADVTVTNNDGKTALDFFADNTAMLELCGGYLDRNMGSRKPLLK